jgi:hypothetical protein
MDAAVFDGYRDAWNTHDVDALLEFFTDDGVYEDVTAARVNREKRRSAPSSRRRSRPSPISH